MTGGKDAKTSWMVRLEKLRNQNFHSFIHLNIKITTIKMPFPIKKLLLFDADTNDCLLKYSFL